jgi:uncharacterized protein YbjT (DUF2867 family)
VTGAAGFVGSRVIARLAQEGETPRALVRNPEAARRRLPASGVEVVQGDTTQPQTLPAAVAGVETIVHAAFITAERKQGPGVNYEETNVRGTANLVAAARQAGVRRIVVISGLGTRPAAPGSYMQGRYLAEQEVRTSGLGWSILGPSVQFGRGSAFFGGLADLIRKAPLVPMVGDGSRRFQPIWVEDVVTCLLKMVREPERYEGAALEVGGPEIYTYAQILDMLMSAMSVRKLRVPGPIPFVKLGAALMEATLSRPPITRAAVGLFSFDNITTLDAVEHHFGFAPLSLRTYLLEYGIG